MAWGGKIPYDSDFENQLKTSYSIVIVPQIKEAAEERKGTKENKPVKLLLNLKHPELYNQGDDGACSFFSTICSMLMVRSGKEHLKKMFLGQDDGFVYIKFPTPQPFGIVDVDEFLKSFEGKWHYGFDKAQYFKKNVFKVSKEIVEGHTPLSEFKDAPGWFRLLAAAYFKAIQFIHEEIDSFVYLPTSFYVSYYQGEIKETTINVLSGKPLFLRLNIKDAYDNNNFCESSLFIDRPIINYKDGVHGRAMHISENQVRFFDSLEAKKGVFISNMFTELVNLKDIEEELTLNINSLLQQLKIVSEQISEEEEENASRKEGKSPEDEIIAVTNKHKSVLVEKYEQLCLKIAESLEQHFPLCESAKPLNIAKLAPQEFIIRLYAELTKSNLLQLEVLDL